MYVKVPPLYLTDGSQPEYYLKTHLAEGIHPHPGLVRNHCGVLDTSSSNSLQND